MTTHRELEMIGFSKTRIGTIFYCRSCRIVIGELWKPPNKFDFFNADLCSCSNGLRYDLELDEVVWHFRPALDYLKPLPFSIRCRDIGLVVRVRSKVGSGVVP